MTAKTIKVKAAAATIAFQLEDVTGLKPSRIFVATPARPTSIPVDYARSLYNKQSTINWIKKGKLIILEGKEQLEESAVNEGYISSPIKPIEHKEILNVLKGNDITKIKELLNGEDRDIAFEIARDSREELNLGVLKVVETELGVTFSND